jgi:hypothetical protein
MASERDAAENKKIAEEKARNAQLYNESVIKVAQMESKMVALQQKISELEKSDDEQSEDEALSSIMSRIAKDDVESEKEDEEESVEDTSSQTEEQQTSSEDDEEKQTARVETPTE